MVRDARRHEKCNLRHPISRNILINIYMANCTEKSTFAVKTPYEKDEGGNDSHFFGICTNC